MNFNLDPKRKKEVITLIIVFLAVLLISAFAVYFIAGRQSVPGTSRQEPQAGVPAQQPAPTDRRSATPSSAGNENFLDRLFGARQGEVRTNGEPWAENGSRISLRLVLAALLGAALAFRPRRRSLSLKRNPYVAQTQILLTIVAAALMIIVGDNAARAFGIFAAVSLVRFRTKIRDPMEITVLLISLALGLATGVGRPDLAVILCIFVLVVLWILEHFESQQVFRTMDLKVVTKDVETTQNALKTVLSKHGFISELRAVSRDGDERAGTIVNSVDVSPAISTDALSEEVLAQDSGNITSIEWEQKKSFSYLYK